MSPLIRTGFFGGSFNPVHDGHLRLAGLVLEKGLVDEVWFVVSPKNPLKSTVDPEYAQERLLAVQKALKQHPHTLASDIEFSLPIPSYTIDTLRHATSLFPEREFILMIGGDNLDSLTQWKDYEFLLSKYDILVYPRTGASNRVPATWKRVTLLDAPFMNISSTDIRKALE